MDTHQIPTPALPELATKLQVAAFAQISPRTVRRLVASNAIPYVRIGRQLRFPGAAIREAFTPKPAV